MIANPLGWLGAFLFSEGQVREPTFVANRIRGNITYSSHITHISYRDFCRRRQLWLLSRDSWISWFMGYWKPREF